MKTPRFWYPHPGQKAAPVLRFLLTPFSVLFQTASHVRKIVANPYRATVPVICVGNVVAGGAGKTPTAIALVRLLIDRGYKTVFVTRGYGGSGKVTHVDPSVHSARDVGDEALLLARTAPTWAGSNRKAALRQAEHHGAVIVMDDGMQNPTIAPTLSIMVLDGDTGLGNGSIIPAGPLREYLNDALMRTAAVIIIGSHDRHNLASLTEKPVFRANLEPELPPDFPRDAKFVAFAGIARPEKFYKTARSAGLNVVDTCDFADHHTFCDADIELLRSKAKTWGARLLTTEKDAIRLPLTFRSEPVVMPARLVFDSPSGEAAFVKLCISSCAL